MTPVASVIIPTFQHAAHVGKAIDSALAQTVPVEVIVADDGSTDNTTAVLQRYGDRIRVLRLPHGGVCAARNAALDIATGEHIQLLDADDTIAPDKIALQADELARHPECGWVLCDVEIWDTGKRTTAAQRYHYDQREMSGWLQPQLLVSNFIPISSPLVRRSVISDLIRFHEHLVPEDWHFWVSVSAVARARHLPRILATYHRSRTGRASTHFSARKTVQPGVTPPLRLNLGCGVEGTDSWHPLPGFCNLDRSLGWRWEDGLGEFADASVAGISISHSLMYVDEKHWPMIFSELARVLVAGGVVRITEDHTTHPQSSRLGGWSGSDPAVTLTDPEKLRGYLERYGLTVFDMAADSTRYADRSLCQSWHGTEPDVFYLEGVKQEAVLFSPHHDDETLFGAFTILRYRPRVVICYPSPSDYGDTETRLQETREAMAVLGGNPVEQWQGGDLVAQMREFDRRNRPLRVFAPSSKCSHAEHRAVAQAAREVFGGRLTAYQTYDRDGKVTDGREVPVEAEWVEAKLRALARYKTQLHHPRAWRFFVFDLCEFYE